MNSTFQPAARSAKSALMRSGKGRHASKLLHQIVESVQAFCPGEQGDDLTVIVAVASSTTTDVPSSYT